ncbi:MAG: flagellar biosynthetic protein FliR [Burkholderiales bacterium]|nr:flagellar biosynthetic protein FliR [Burkholderiales bacterium]
MVVFTQAQLDVWLATFLLPFFRILALFSAAPILSHRSFSVRGRVALAALIAMVVAPVVSVPGDISLTSSAAFGVVAQQVLVGLAVGFAARLVFAVLEIAGEFIGLQMGFSFAGFFDPNGRSETAIGTWLQTMGLMLFVTTNAHLIVLDVLIDTFTLFPISTDPFRALAGLRLDLMGAEVFRLALMLALPFTVLMLFVNLVLGFVSRVAPQLSIFAVGFPITLTAGLSVLTISTIAMLTPFETSLKTFLAPFR